MFLANLSLLFCLFLLILLITNSLGQLSFTNPFASSPGEYTVTQKSNGKLLTLSTKKSFSWLLADPMSDHERVYVSLLCVSSGSVVDFGVGSHVKNGYPDRYSEYSVIMPLVRDNFVEPNLPTLAASGDMLTAGETLMFELSSPGWWKSEVSGHPSSAATFLSPTYNTLSFEILGCGMATWCLQAPLQFQANPGVCQPAETTKCSAPTCTSVPYQISCSTSPKVMIHDRYCLNQCPASTIQVEHSSQLSVCATCNSRCAQCTEIPTKCTACPPNSYLNENTCDSSCPVGTFQDDSTWTCKPCPSNCQDCSETPSKCTSCFVGYFLHENTCNLDCPTGMFKGGTWKCELCSFPCQNCEKTSSKCTSCVENKFLYRDNCWNECPEGYVPDYVLGECQKKFVKTTERLAGWKLAVVILSSIIIIATCIIIYVNLKVRARDRAKSEMKDLPI